MIANLVLILIYIYWGCYYYHSPISSCVFSFLSLCTCFLLIVCNLLLLFHTKMPWWFLFKMFQKYMLSKSFLPWTFFLQSFLRVCFRIDFIVFNKWIWVEWFMTSLICSFVYCGFVTDCQMGRLLEHMRIMLGTYVNIELANPLTKRTLLVIGWSKMCLILQGTKFQVQVLKPCKSVQESSEEVLDFKT